MPRSLVFAVAVPFLLLAAPVAAQEATPAALPAIPAGNECQVAPRTIDSVFAAWSDGTPVPSFPDVDSEDQLPHGTPADAATIAAVTAVEREFAACYNAAQWLRTFALFTDDALRTVAGNYADREELAGFLATVGTPEVDASGEMQIVLVAVRDVRVLPDGRVGAVVEWGRGAGPQVPVDEANFHIYVKTNDGWRLDEEISGFAPWYEHGNATPPAWQTP